MYIHIYDHSLLEYYKLSHINKCNMYFFPGYTKGKGNTIRERGKITQIHDRSHSWFGTGTSIIIG